MYRFNCIKYYDSAIQLIVEKFHLHTEYFQSHKMCSQLFQCNKIITWQSILLPLID